jgi:hypothetical protein
MEYIVPQRAVKVEVRAGEDNVMRALNESHGIRKMACKYTQRMLIFRTLIVKHLT